MHPEKRVLYKNIQYLENKFYSKRFFGISWLLGRTSFSRFFIDVSWSHGAGLFSIATQKSQRLGSMANV